MYNNYIYSPCEDDTKTCTCPHCSCTVGANGIVAVGDGILRMHTLARCPACDCPFIINYDESTYPPCKPFEAVKHLPEDIEKLYDECRMACGSGLFTSASMLARTIIMHVAVEKGADNNKTFQYYVDYLAEKNYIPPNSKEWVDKIRSFGNGSVHRLEIREKEETELVIKFLMYLLKIIYELPNEL